MKTLSLFFVLAGVLFAQHGHASDVYQNPHDVLIDTIRNGHAEGILTGTIARKFEQQFHGNGPLLFGAKKLVTYKQSGCARVAFDYTQQGVPTPQGVTEVKLKTEMNCCLDGRAPQSLELAE